MAAACGRPAEAAAGRRSRRRGGLQGGSAAVAAWHLAAGRAAAAAGAPARLDLEAFEDTDCLEDQKSEALLELLADLCTLLERALPGRSGAVAETWAELRAWREQFMPLLIWLSTDVLDKPYCEPGKVAVSAATCLLLMEEPGTQAAEKQREQALVCIKDIEEMLQETAPGQLGAFDTRLHMFLRSPWPAFRLLDLLVRLHPSDEERAEPDLGRCRPHEDWVGELHEFDWPWFKASLTSALEAATRDIPAFALRSEDGPMSEQYRARWARVYRAPSFREAAAFGSSAFYKFRRSQWEAGCNPGIVASYVMQVVTFCARDTEAWLHRYVGAAWRLMNLLAPLTSLIYTDWPIFLALHLGSLLRRHPSPWMPGKWRALDAVGSVEPHAGQRPAETLEALVWGALDPLPQVVYVTAAWGALSQFVGAVLARWTALALPLLLLLALDGEAAESCAAQERPGAIACLSVPQRFGVEAFVAKYITLAVVARTGALAVWLDLDVYLPTDPTSALEAALRRAGSPPLAIAGFLTSASLSPAVLAARGAEASGLLLRYAAWLYEHPYLPDHQGWDAFLHNKDGDFGSGWDYKGRNISSTPDDGLQFSFAPGLCASGTSGHGAGACGAPRYALLGREFASGDGWLGRPEGLASFHFWGASEGQAELFRAFYPFEELGFSPDARALLAQYRRAPAAGDAGSLAARAQPRAHLTAITYAHGCCAQAIERNRRSALAVGADAARAYGFEDLDPEWVARNAQVLSLPKGAGWWLWKPYLILKTLRDEAVPWHTGVVLWLDAGNFFVGDPQPVVARALQASDVAAMRLKCCMESDWTSAPALQRLGGSHHTIADRPQLGAYFILFRKTTTTLAFVEDWLRFAENPEILLDLGGASNMYDAPGYQRHMADQSIFSVLFKQRGFEALALEEGHRVVQLDRWRE